MILNDSSLFSNSADITTKEILKRYGDRAKAPTVNNPMSPGGEEPPRSREGRGEATVVHRVDSDQHQQNAWQNESSVRHVGSEMDRAPNLPYANPNGSTESHGSPNRGLRGGAFDKQRAMGVA